MSAPAGQPRAIDWLGDLGGSMVALVTPFHDGRVDTEALVALCQRQVQRGSAALVVCGSTGEAPALSAEEHAGAVATAVRAAAGRVPVVAGCGAPATEPAAALARAAAQAGARALLCAPPPYVKPTQEGVCAHMRAVSHAADRPIILYDVPGRTGVAVSDATVARLFERGLIFAVKDATADLGRPPRLRRLCGDGLRQFSGDDATAVAHRAMGGHGCISVAANLVPALCAALHAAWDRSDLARVDELRDLLEPLHEVLFLESNPIPLKAALAMLRLCDGDLRLPLTRANGTTRDRLAVVLASLVRAEEDSAGRPLISLVR